MIDKDVAIGIAASISILVTATNGAAISLIIRRRRLQRITNWPLFSLALADLSVGLFLGPIAIAQYASSSHVNLCRANLLLESFCCTASLLNMLVASGEQWTGVFRPLKYPTYVTKKSIGLVITCAWILPLLFVILEGHSECKIAQSYCIWRSGNNVALLSIKFVALLMLSLVMGLVQVKVYKLVRYHSRIVAPATGTGNNRQGDTSEIFTITKNQETITSTLLSGTYSESKIQTYNLLCQEQPKMNYRTPLRPDVIIKEENLQHSTHSSTLGQVSATSTNTCRRLNNDINGNCKLHHCTSQKAKCDNLRASAEETHNASSHHCEVETSGPISKSSEAYHGSKRKSSTSAFIIRRLSSRLSIGRAKCLDRPRRRPVSVASILYMIQMLLWIPYLLLQLLLALKICNQTCIDGHSIMRCVLPLNSLINPFVYTIRLYKLKKPIKEFLFSKLNCKKRKR
eukprot:gene5122-5771_t